MKLTHSKLLQILHYDPDTGDFTWLVSRRQGLTGKKAGSVNTHFKTHKRYVLINTHGKHWKAHRLAWFYVTGKEPEKYIDHINGDGTDNRWCNLRLVSRVENARNQRRHKCNSYSNVMGVRWSKISSRWCAFIGYQNKQIYLGSFVDFNEAVKVRKDAEVRYGYHPNHGKDRPL